MEDMSFDYQMQQFLFCWSKHTQRMHPDEFPALKLQITDDLYYADYVDFDKPFLVEDTL